MPQRRRDFCPQCGCYLDADDRIDRHNLTCAHTGERAYGTPPPLPYVPPPLPAPVRNTKRIPR